MKGFICSPAVFTLRQSCLCFPSKRIQGTEHQISSGSFHPPGGNPIFTSKPVQDRYFNHGIRSCPNLTFGYFCNLPKKGILKFICLYNNSKFHHWILFFFLLYLYTSVCERVPTYIAGRNWLTWKQWTLRVGMEQERYSRLPIIHIYFFL